MKNRVNSVPPSRKRGRGQKRKVSSTLPDEIHTEILSWLPAKDVLRYQCVCWKWKNQTSSKQFMDLHTQRGMRSSSPMVFVKEGYREYYFLDKWCVPNRTKSQIHRFVDYPHCQTYFSIGGFLVLGCNGSNDFIFLNPINHGQIRIVVPTRLDLVAHVCGIFFNPNLKEHCVLFGIGLWESGWVSERDGFIPETIKYKRLNLGSNSKPTWTEISIPFSHKTRLLDLSPVLTDEYLYWMVNPGEVDMNKIHDDIIEYDINTDVFTLICNPVPKTAYIGKVSLDLLNIDGFLSLVLVAIRSRGTDINIWTLRDRTKQLWTNSEYHISALVYQKVIKPRALAIVDGELLISCSENEKLFVCSLKRGTIRKFGKNGYANGVSFFPHVISLASLSDCESKIFMKWEEDESKEVGSL